MTKKSVVVLFDENKNVIAATDPTIGHSGISHEISPRPGQTLLEVEIPSAAYDSPSVDFKRAISEAMTVPGAVRPWKSQRTEVEKKHK